MNPADRGGWGTAPDRRDIGPAVASPERPQGRPCWAFRYGLGRSLAASGSSRPSTASGFGAVRRASRSDGKALDATAQRSRRWLPLVIMRILLPALSQKNLQAHAQRIRENTKYHMQSSIPKSSFQVYLPKDGEYRAFFSTENPRLTRTVLLPVSTHRMALRLAARLFAEFRQTQVVTRRVPMEIQRIVLGKLLYDYVGQLLHDRSRKWPTVRGYKCNLRQLFQECRWKHLSEITPESFLRWRDSSSRGDYQHNRFLREANAFLDEMTVIGVAPANPLRKIEAVSPSVAESRNQPQNSGLTCNS